MFILVPQPKKTPEIVVYIAKDQKSVQLVIHTETGINPILQSSDVILNTFNIQSDTPEVALEQFSNEAYVEQVWFYNFSVLEPEKPLHKIVGILGSFSIYIEIKLQTNKYLVAIN
jgi:hypothetical protein